MDILLEETIAPILETETGMEMEMVMVAMETVVTATVEPVVETVAVATVEAVTVAVEMVADLYKSAYSDKNDYKIAC